MKTLKNPISLTLPKEHFCSTGSPLYLIWVFFIMKEIKLTQGKVALVDDSDYEYLNQWKWYAQKKERTYYACRRDMNTDKVVFMHRIILNVPHGLFTDHIDHDGLNNQKNNLRMCNKSQNACNSVTKNKYGYRGISINQNGCISARLKINGENRYLGSFKTTEEAALCYDNKIKKLAGEFANLNFK